ncbi:MAG: hypothetical protein GXO64_01425, partial [Candidatus Micrarchaeota archaeon]|nr:hypothetical protein [Candidatus Micrarchaeota archaeon]
MVIFIGHKRHRKFTDSIAMNVAKIANIEPAIFSYETTVFKGFSSDDYNVGERKIKFPEKLIESLDYDKDVVLIVRGEYSRWDSDALFMETCQLIDTLKSGLPNMKGRKAHRLCIVLPKEGYVKQDKIFKDDNGNMIYGESISVLTQRKVLKLLGADIILTVYPHDFRLPKDEEGWISTTTGKGEELQNWTGFAWAINPSSLLADYFISNKIKIDIVIAPDKGAYDFAKFIAEKIGAQCAYLDAHRSRKDATKITTRNMLDVNLTGKNILIPDDWILTGSKTKNAIDILKGGEFGNPDNIYVSVVHGEMTGDTYRELVKRGIMLLCSNTIENPEATIDITPLLAKRI